MGWFGGGKSGGYVNPSGSAYQKRIKAVDKEIRARRSARNAADKAAIRRAQSMDRRGGAAAGWDRWA